MRAGFLARARDDAAAADAETAPRATPQLVPLVPAPRSPASRFRGSRPYMPVHARRSRADAVGARVEARCGDRQHSTHQQQADANRNSATATDHQHPSSLISGPGGPLSKSVCRVIGRTDPGSESGADSWTFIWDTQSWNIPDTQFWDIPASGTPPSCYPDGRVRETHNLRIRAAVEGKRRSGLDRRAPKRRSPAGHGGGRLHVRSAPASGG